MPVVLNTPRSFAVIDFLNALAEQLKTFTVVDPETGERIVGELINLPAVGIALEAGVKQLPVGFPTPTLEPESEVFVIEAVLFFEPDPKTPLPADLKDEVWEMKVEHAEFVCKLEPIAEALSQQFGAVVILNPYSMEDDSRHLQPEPVDPRFPAGAQVCRILKVKNT